MTPSLSVRDVNKSFFATQALKNITFGLTGGEILALVGENGAGKSTLVNILSGVHRPDSGNVSVNGQELAGHGPWDARRVGIGVVQQHPALIDRLSVMENIYLGSRLPKLRTGLVNFSAMERHTAALLERVRVSVHPRTAISALGIAVRQLVAVAKALHGDPSILLLDEVTAPLDVTAVDRVTDVVRSEAAQGVGVVYVSHRLSEVLSLATRVLVLRDGTAVADEAIGKLSPEKLEELIVGRSLAGSLGVHRVAGAAPEPGADRPALELRELEGREIRAISLGLRRGEVVGLAGLVGSGRTELLELIYGLRERTGGSVLIDGKEVTGGPPELVKSNVGLVTEERSVGGIMPRVPVWRNFTLPKLDRYKRAGLLSRRRELNAASQSCQAYRVRGGLGQPIAELSGGNQQKVLLARWLAQGVRVLLLAEPTYGVDIGAKQEIYEIISARAAEGLSALISSSELEELEHLCDRVIVMQQGAVVAEVSGESLTASTMLRLLLKPRPAD